MTIRTVLRLVVSVAVSSQLMIAGTTGKIAGKVVDAKTNEAIPFASVVVVGTSLGASSDPEGKYVILNVPPGMYTVAASLIGYQGARVVDVGVSVDFTTTLDFTLKESTVELSEVVVQGERSPLIRQDQTNPVVAVSSENIQTLPVTSISQIVGLQAGVVVDDDGAIHVRGGRSNEILYTLNGIAVNNPYDNQSSIGVATNALQEVSVSTGTFSAEYGNALSGVVNYVTREGGAKYTGSMRVLAGDYMSNRKDLFPHIGEIDPLNQSRNELTFGGPLPLLEKDFSFYASGVYEKNNGYLYGDRLYRPTDFHVSRNILSYNRTTYDPSVKYFSSNSTTGDTTWIDKRYGGLTDVYYFNPLNKSMLDSLGRPSGNGEVVPLNTSDSYNIQANLAYRLSATMKLKYEIVADKGHSYTTSYYSYRFNPDGRPQNFSKGILHSLEWTHTLSNSLFYTAKGSYNKSEDKTSAFESIKDSRYLPAFYQTALPGTGFYTGGTYLGRTTRSTETYSGKFDLVGQLFDVHELKFGIEARTHTVRFEDYTLRFVAVSGPTKIITKFEDVYLDSLKYVAAIPDVASGYAKYKHKPLQFSVYMQDKIEVAKSLILNAGLRYEYFDPDAKYNNALSQEYGDQKSIFIQKNLVQASVKQSLSPRISVAYPITDQGVIRFSYGHFYQFGNLSGLYQNPNFRAPDGSRPSFGSADVNPQRSVQYEIGFQQGLTPDLRLEVVGFYKDVRDYIFSQIVKVGKGDLDYQVLTNLAYANSRGITVSLLQRRSPGGLFSAAIDYTFAVAEGNRTEPLEDFFYSEKSGKSTETFLVPLGFDRTHTLNATIGLNQSDNWSLSTIGRVRKGSPYTPSVPASLSLQQTQFIQNSASKPWQWSVDMRADKIFTISDLRFSIFLQVDNLFDTENEIDVYSNSGRALYNANAVANPTEFSETRNRIIRGDPGMIPLQAISDYYVDPQNVGRPRLVRVGLSLFF